MMELHTSPGKIKKKRRKQLDKIKPSNRQIKIHVADSSLQDLFKKSLYSMAYELKNGLCKGANHYDYTAKISSNATSYKGLLVDFLTKVLALTHAQHTIFCTMYIEEFTETKLVAQLYGKWFNNYNNHIKFVVGSGFTVKQNKDGYMGLLVFET